MGWNYEGWALKFGRGRGQKKPGDRCVRTQCLDCHNTHIERYNSKLSLFYPPFQRVTCSLRRTALTLRQEVWAKYPARVDFWSRFRGVFSGHRVVAIAAKRVTSTQAPQDQRGAFEGAVLFQRLKRIGRAGRLIPAIKSHPGAKKQPVKPHGQGEDMGKDRHGLPCNFRKAAKSSSCSALNLVVAVTLARPMST